MVDHLESLSNAQECLSPRYKSSSPSTPPLIERPDVFQLSPSFGQVQTLETVKMILPPPLLKFSLPSVGKIMSNIGKRNPDLAVDSWIVQRQYKDVFYNICLSLRVNEGSLRVLERLNYKVVVFPKVNYYAYFKKACDVVLSTDEWLPLRMELDYERTCRTCYPRT